MEENLKRYLSDLISEDLKARMVFVGGPRQVGKTTLSLNLLDPPDSSNPAYLNWDDVRVHSSLLRGELPPNQPLIVFDEIHKFARWRNLLKGFYDTRGAAIRFLITGSARLDYYRKGGDSLHGRYHYYRLHPFSLPEISTNPKPSDLSALLKFGGFPEPLLKGEETFWRRWQKERRQRVIYDDIRDLERIKEITLLELLAEELPRRVGSPLSVKNLRESLEVAHETAERWVEIFERMYYCFRISPYGATKLRAVKKEKKLYLWDWSTVNESGARFENLVACQLLKYCHLLEDSEGYRMELRFLRDTDRREVDFIVLKEGKPLFAVECKTGERDISPALFYFKERVMIPKCFQVHTGTRDYEKQGIRVLPFYSFCKEASMP